MILYCHEKNEYIQIQPSNPEICKTQQCGCDVAMHAYPSGNIISTGNVTPDEKGRVKGIVVYLCPNPNHCRNIDRQFPIKKQVLDLLCKKN